jgi:hypothetical protein
VFQALTKQTFNSIILEKLKEVLESCNFVDSAQYIVSNLNTIQLDPVLKQQFIYTFQHPEQYTVVSFCRDDIAEIQGHDFANSLSDEEITYIIVRMHESYLEAYENLLDEVVDEVKAGRTR